jgi:flagellar hook-associated protein 2
MDLGVSGLASGFDWRTLVDQLIQVERTPATRLLSEQSTTNQRNNAFSSIKTQLGILQSRVEKLKDPEFFNSRVGTSSDTAVASVAASTKASNGSYTLNVTSLATLTMPAPRSAPPMMSPL